MMNYLNQKDVMMEKKKKMMEKKMKRKTLKMKMMMKKKKNMIQNMVEKKMMKKKRKETKEMKEMKKMKEKKMKMRERILLNQYMHNQETLLQIPKMINKFQEDSGFNHILVIWDHGLFLMVKSIKIYQLNHFQMVMWKQY